MGSRTREVLSLVYADDPVPKATDKSIWLVKGNNESGCNRQSTYQVQHQWWGWRINYASSEKRVQIGLETSPVWGAHPVLPGSPCCPFHCLYMCHWPDNPLSKELKTVLSLLLAVCSLFNKAALQIPEKSSCVHVPS